MSGASTADVHTFFAIVKLELLYMAVGLGWVDIATP